MSVPARGRGAAKTADQPWVRAAYTAGSRADNSGKSQAVLQAVGQPRTMGRVIWRISMRVCWLGIVASVAVSAAGHAERAASHE